MFEDGVDVPEELVALRNRFQNTRTRGVACPGLRCCARVRGGATARGGAALEPLPVADVRPLVVSVLGEASAEAVKRAMEALNPDNRGVRLLFVSLCLLDVLDAAGRGVDVRMLSNTSLGRDNFVSRVQYVVLRLVIVRAWRGCCTRCGAGGGLSCLRVKESRPPADTPSSSAGRETCDIVARVARSRSSRTHCTFLYGRSLPPCVV